MTRDKIVCAIATGSTDEWSALFFANDALASHEYTSVEHVVGRTVLRSEGSGEFCGFGNFALLEKNLCVLCVLCGEKILCISRQRAIHNIFTTPLLPASTPI